MRFRSLLAGVAVFLSGTASAAGAYDGIYQVPGLQEFYSVHQSGNGLIIGGFFTQPQSTYFYTLINGQRYTPPRNDNWDLFSGPIAGARAVVEGETASGACTASLEFVFGSPTVITILNMQPTASGLSQGINCASVLNALTVRLKGRVFTVNRVF